MMWKLLFLLIATAAATDYEDAERCSSLVLDQCDQDDPPRGFPGNEEELDEFCKFAAKFLPCATSVSDECEEFEPDIKQLRELNSNLNRICDKDSLLHNVLADTLPCLKKNMDQLMDCPRSEEVLGNFGQALTSSGLTVVEETHPEPNACLRVLYAVGCLTANVNKFCGDVARDVLIELFQLFDYPFEECRPGVKAHLPSIVNAMVWEEEIEEVEKMIKRKKK